MSWDAYLFRGTAAYYERGRMPYAGQLPEVLRDELGLDPGTSVVADLGCGPGTLSLQLARHAARVIAVDPDPDMVLLGRERAAAARICNVEWHNVPAEEISFTPGELDAAVFGQSFHWMDRARVAAGLRRALRSGGRLALVTDVKSVPPRSAPASAVPESGPGLVPRAEVDALITEYLGPVRRAGRKLLPEGTPRDEEAVLADAGFAGPRRMVIPAPGALLRTVEDLVAEVYSKSSSDVRPGEALVTYPQPDGQADPRNRRSVGAAGVQGVPMMESKAAAWDLRGDHIRASVRSTERTRSVSRSGRRNDCAPRGAQRYASPVHRAAERIQRPAPIAPVRRSGIWTIRDC